MLYRSQEIWWALQGTVVVGQYLVVRALRPDKYELPSRVFSRDSL